MNLKEKLQDYSRAEFINMLHAIINVTGSRLENNRLIEHFDTIVKHPNGSDLLFTPFRRLNSDSLASDVCYFVKDWYNDQELLAFKDDVLPQPSRPYNATNAQQNAVNWSSRTLNETRKLSERATQATTAAHGALQRMDELLNELSAYITLPLAGQDSTQAFTLCEQHLSILKTFEHDVITAAYQHNYLEASIGYAKRIADFDLTSPFFVPTLRISPDSFHQKR